MKGYHSSASMSNSVFTSQHAIRPETILQARMSQRLLHQFISLFILLTILSKSTTFLNFLNQAKTLKNSEFQLNAKMISSLHISFFLKQAKVLNIMMSDTIKKVIQTVLKNVQSMIQAAIDNI